MALLEEDMIHSMVLILVDIILQLGIHLQRLIFIPSNLSKFSDQNCLNSASVFPALSAGRYSFYQAKHERLHKNQEKWELLLLLTSDNEIQSREQCSQVLWFFHWWNNQCVYIILAQCFSNLFLIVSLKEDSMISPDHLLQVLLSTELEKKNSSTLKYWLRIMGRWFFSPRTLPDHSISTLFFSSRLFQDSHFTCGIIFFQTKPIFRVSNWTKNTTKW